MSKSQPVTQSSTQTNSIPAWLTQASQGVAGNAGNLPGYSAYSGPNLYGNLTPQQLQAMGLASSAPGQAQNVSMGAYNPLSSLTGFGGQMIDANSLGSQIPGLMNPYTQNVIDATNTQIDRNTAQAQSGADTSLAAQHAFGGSRQGVADAVTQSLGAQNKNQIASQLNQGNYQQALSTALAAAQGNQGAAQAAAGTRLGAAGALSGLGGQLGQLTSADIANLLGTGQVGQQTETGQLGSQYQTGYLNQYQIPESILGSQAGALGALPHSTTQTGQQTQMSYSNPLMGLAGLGLGIGSLGIGGGNTLGGSALSWLFSDRRLKEDVSKVGALADGTPLYRYRFKGDPKWQVGLMADEVDPAAVHMHPSGFKMVDYARATERSARLEGLLQ